MSVGKAVAVAGYLEVSREQLASAREAGGLMGPVTRVTGGDAYSANPTEAIGRGVSPACTRDRLDDPRPRHTRVPPSRLRFFSAPSEGPLFQVKCGPCGMRTAEWKRLCDSGCAQHRGQEPIRKSPPRVRAKIRPDRARNRKPVDRCFDWRTRKDSNFQPPDS